MVLAITILSGLLALAVVCVGFLAYLLLQKADEVVDKNDHIGYLEHKNWLVESELELERSLSTQTRRELEDAFSNLEMVLGTEKIPGENSGKNIQEINGNPAALYYDRSTGEHYPPAGTTLTH